MNSATKNPAGVDARDGADGDGQKKYTHGGWRDQAQLMLRAAADRRVTRSAIAVLGQILQHLNRATGESFPGFKAIGKNTGFKKRTFLEAIELLEQAEYVTVVRQGGLLNRYRPTWSTGADERTTTSALECTSQDEDTGALSRNDRCASAQGTGALECTLTKDISNQGKSNRGKEHQDAAHPADTLFGAGLRILERRGVKSARPLIGKLRKSVGDEKALQLLLEIDRNDISEPAAWLSGAMNRAKAKASTSISRSFADGDYQGSSDEHIDRILGAA